MTLATDIVTAIEGLVKDGAGSNELSISTDEIQMTFESREAMDATLEHWRSIAAEEDRVTNEKPIFRRVRLRRRGLA